MAIPKLALIPSSQGSKLYSVLPSNGVGDFAFTRGTSATRINSRGLIETVASGVSRLNYPLIDGVVNGCPSHLLEPSRLQLIEYSEAFDNNAWAKQNVIVTSNSLISPDGTLNADKLTDDSVNGAHRITDAFTTSATGSFTYSIFLKKGTLTTAQFQVFNANTASSANVDLVNGIITSGGEGVNHKIENYGNDWFRCSISGTLSNTTTTVYLYLKQKPDYIGNGDYLYAWGAQLEEGSFPTSYIPNYGTAAGVTRSAETANGAGDATTFNDSEGVLFAEISAQEISNASSRRTISLSDGTNDNRVYISFDSEYNKLNIFIIVGTTQIFTSNVDISKQNSFNKITVKYKSGDSSIYVNGFLVDSFSNTFSGGNFNTLKFSNKGSGELFYGNTKQIQYFDTALNDSDLETLTSWVSFTDMANGQLYTIE